jgi:hypothetical protein
MSAKLSEQISDGLEYGYNGTEQERQALVDAVRALEYRCEVLERLVAALHAALSEYRSNK